MKNLIATTALFLTLLSSPAGWAQFVPGPNPIGGTNFQASYAGSDGNDLTLTVVP